MYGIEVFLGRLLAFAFDRNFGAKCNKKTILPCLCLSVALEIKLGVLHMCGWRSLTEL